MYLVINLYCEFRKLIDQNHMYRRLMNQIKCLSKLLIFFMFVVLKNFTNTYNVFCIVQVV